MESRKFQLSCNSAKFSKISGKRVPENYIFDEKSFLSWTQNYNFWELKNLIKTWLESNEGKKKRFHGIKQAFLIQNWQIS